MTTPETIESILEEALLKRSQRAHTTTAKPSFNKIPTNKAQILGFLTAEYLQIVKERNQGEVEPPKELDAVAEWLSCSNYKPWLCLMGQVGNGKTTAVKAVVATYKELKKAAEERLKERYNLTKELQKRLEAVANLQEVAIFSAKAISVIAQTKPEEFEAIKRTSTLIIDDVGTEPLKVLYYGTESNPIADILLARYETHRMTVLTTNLDFAAICNRYGTRNADRLKERAAKIYFENKSYR